MPAAIFRALRHRNFQLFFSGQLISLIGTWMQNIAQSWLVYRLSHSPLALGLVGFAGQAPIFLLSPPAGVVVDRVNRHRLIVVTQTASMILALVLAAATFAHRETVSLVMVLALLLGVVNAFDIPARQAFLVEMVESREDLMNAIALNSSMFNAARIAGPAIAGMLLAKVGEAWCFFLNGVSYIAVIVGLLMMRLRPFIRRAVEASMLAHFMEGYRYVRSIRPIYALLIMLGIVSVVAMPYVVLMPIFADQILHRGARGLGILMGISGGGALAGALILAARKTVRGLGRVIAICTFGIGITDIGFGASTAFTLSAVMVFLLALCIMIQTAASNTLLQAMVSDDFRGRVMSFYSMMFMGMAPIGSLGAGYISDHLGAPKALILGGAISLVAAAVFSWRLPVLRAAARPLLRDEIKAGEPADVAATGPNYVDAATEEA
jgi:MFS family permease